MFYIKQTACGLENRKENLIRLESNFILCFLQGANDT